MSQGRIGSAGLCSGVERKKFLPENRHRLFRMKILSETHLRKLRSLQRSWSVKGEAGRQLEFWDEPLQSGQEVTIRVAPSALKSVEKTLRSANVTYSTLTEDLQK